MDIFTIIFLVIALLWLFISLKKDKKKTINSLKASKVMMKSNGKDIIPILFLIGLILTFIPPDTIQKYMDGSILSTITSALLGSITLIPAFVAFPLVSSLLDNGAQILPVVSFLTTLTMVGVVTFSLEKKEFGIKFALLRNILSFLSALIIAVFMGGIL